MELDYIEDKVYMGGILLLLAVELFLTIPLMTDSMAKEGSTVIVLVAVGHFFLWLFGKTGLVQQPLGLPHFIGIAGFAVSLMPVIGFIWHGLISIILLKYVINMWKQGQKSKKLNNDISEKN